MTTSERAREPRVLVLGASGMLGHTILRVFARSQGLEVVGSVRSPASASRMPRELQDRLVTNVDVENLDSVTRLLASVRPTVVINAVGLVKQLSDANDPLAAIPINALLPHRLARLCDVANARLIHVSTDCVFSGRAGMYKESDESDAKDLYGRSKFLGELHDAHTVTLRTSIIGHELASANGLIEWFLAQEGSANGYNRAIFSGLPTVELARVIRDYVIPRADLSGLYHVSSEPIDKLSLLSLVAKVYGKTIRMVPSDKVVIDRSLDSSRFRELTGYRPPSWEQLVTSMHDFG
jgi:dTDP-4-dehydrorhamnose reductase